MSWETNLLRLANVGLRNLTIQIGIGGPDKRELNTLEFFKLERWAALGFELFHNDLDIPGHPFLDTLWEWHVQGNAPKSVSKTGKFAVYMPFGVKTPEGLTTKVAALDLDIFRKKDGGEADETKRREFLEASAALHQREGIPFLWSLSRSYGIHAWYYFDEALDIASAHNFVLSIRQLHNSEGLYGDISNSDLENIADPRPKVPNASAVSFTHRLLCPYSSWYPHAKLFDSYDTDYPVSDDYSIPTVDVGVIQRLAPPTKTKPTQKIETPNVESEPTTVLDIPHITYPASPTWMKVTSEEFRRNKKKLDSFESDLDIDGLIPCASSIMANKTQIPEGQWHNFAFLVSQSIASLNHEDKETALDQVTETLNLIGSFGNYPPDDAETFRTTINSAYREFEKGLPPACKRVGIARDNCCPAECNLARGGYLGVQGVITSTLAPKVFKRMYTDPLVVKHKSPRYVSLCIPAFLLPEFHDAELPEEIFFEFDMRETLKFDRFAATLMSFGVKNIEKYDTQRLLSIFPQKDFSKWIREMLDNLAVIIEDPRPFYRSAFLGFLGKIISRFESLPLGDNPKTDAPIRIWFDRDGSKCMAILRSTLLSVPRDLIQRSGGIDSDAVLDHYVEHVLPGAKPLDYPIPYIDINFPENEKMIPLDAGVKHYLDLTYLKIKQGLPNVEIMDRHRTKEKKDDKPVEQNLRESGRKEAGRKDDPSGQGNI